MKPISTELAIRIRASGRLLPPEAKYVDQRVKEIARRQNELAVEMKQLDQELQHRMNPS